MSVAILPEIVDAVLTFAPEIMRIPVLGRLLSGLGAEPINDATALERFQRDADRNKRTRTRTQRDNNKRVIKVNDALQCVDKTVNSPAVALKFGRALAGVIAGGSENVGDLIYKEIEQCILRKRLGQTNPRSGNVRRTSSHRISAGHGKGRKKLRKKKH